MILRQLISTFLIQAMLLTSASAYSPNNKTVFLMNEERELRCQITTEAAKLFSLEQLENLIQKDALAVKIGESQINEFRPCDEDDAFYAEIVFSDLDLTSIPTDRSNTALLLVIGIVIAMSGLIGIMIGTSININKKQKNQDVDETIRAICGEKDALVAGNEVQCLDER